MTTEAGGAARYARQMQLPEIGARGQEQLARARVLVVGVGGLGSPAALYLAGAGVGHIGLMDPDRLELSNLQRQILHDTGALGSPKVESAAMALRERNPAVAVTAHAEAIDAERARALFRDYDFVIDGTDSVAAKYAINDAAALTGTPYSHAGVIGWLGQTMTVLPGKSPCLRCLFPTPPDEEDLPTCQTAGILGAVAGAVGLVQATEALKFLLGLGELLAGRLLVFDALALHWRAVLVPRNPVCPACSSSPTLGRPRE